MAYDDKDLKRIFPTANSGDIGAHHQRTWIDNLGGADQIRTKVRLEETDTCKTETRLRTRAGQPDFVVNKVCSGGEELPVYMDSGVVDLLSVSPYNPLTLAPAPLYYGSAQRAYFAANKLLGKIVPPSVNAPNPPPEFSPGLSFGSKGNDLVGKKDAAAKCPASMFTGKARLYAQALYGGDLRDWKWTLDIPLGLSPRIVHDNGAVLHTSCGVYRDDKNTHWIIAIHPDGIRITKLVRDSRVDALVPLLSDPAMAADYDKIEAYILAYSPPSSTMTFILDVSVPETQMLGYGWKFNWDGDKADIIQHFEGFPTHSSTHYRFTFFRDSALVGPNNTPEQEALRWTATLSTVSGPHTWHNSKYSQVIANPDWLTNTLSLFGTRSGGIVAGNPPVYCFYKRNTLEIINYFASGGEEALKYSRTALPSTWGLVCDWTSDGWVGMNATVYDTFGTFGTDGGGGEWRQRLYNPVTTGFTCSSASTVSSSQSYTYEKRGLGGKVLGPDALGGYDSDATHNVFLSQNINNYLAPSQIATASDGVALLVGSNSISLDDIAGSDGKDYPGFSRYHTYATLQTKLEGLYFQSGAHVESDLHLLLVPFHDSQACYVYGTRNTYRLYDGFNGDSEVGYTANWGTRIRMVTTYDGGYTYVQEGDWIIYTAHNGSYGYPDSPVHYTGQADSTDTVLASSLVTAFGAYPFTPPISMGVFFSGDDLVSQQFYTHSAAVGPAAFGYGAKNLDGFQDRWTSPPPFIGWA